MLPPHELKNKGFGHALRGYSVAEVDDYIEFLLDRYADVYRRNDQLEKELRMASIRLEELTAKEDAINRALVNAQRLEEKIISDAKNEAELITRSAKTNADRILNDFHRKVSKERQTLHELREAVAAFKESVLGQYVEHINAIRALAPDLESEPEWENDAADYTNEVIEGIRQAAENAAEHSEKKIKLDEILQAHTVEEEGEETVLSDEGEDPYVPPVESAVEVVEEQPAEEEKVPVLIHPVVKRRPRARRTVEKGGTTQVEKQPIPSSPGESDSDTEDALDKLFADSSK